MEILLFRKAIIPQTTPDALLCGVEPDAEAFQFGGIHDKIAMPGVFFDPHMDAHCFGKLPGRAHHIPGIAAAKVVHTAGFLTSQVLLLKSSQNFLLRISM